MLPPRCCGVVCTKNPHKLQERWKPDTAARSALSADPGEKKGLRCIQNTEMQRHSISLKEEGGGGPSPTPRVGHSPWPVTSLKGGNLGEGERNMSEQREQRLGRNSPPLLRATFALILPHHNYTCDIFLYSVSCRLQHHHSTPD